MKEEIQTLSDFRLVFFWVVDGIIDKAGKIEELAASEGTDFDFGFSYV